MVAISDARILAALTLRGRATIKRELQRLCRAHAATCAFLSTASTKGDAQVQIEFAGDPDGLPASRALGGVCTFVCEQRTLRCFDGDEREVVLLYSRVCTGAPVLVLGLVDSRAPFTDVLTDDIEQAAECLESVLVDLLDPEAAAQQPSKVRAPKSG